MRVLRFRMWAVKNSQKRRSARSDGEKSVGARRVAGGRGRGARSLQPVRNSGNMGGGVYADSNGT